MLLEELVDNSFDVTEAFPEESQSSISTWSPFKEVLSSSTTLSDDNKGVFIVEKVFEAGEPSFKEFGVGDFGRLVVGV